MSLTAVGGGAIYSVFLLQLPLERFLDSRINRRQLLGLGAASAAAASVGGAALSAPPASFSNALPWRDGLTDAPHAEQTGNWRYLNAAEVRFLTAAVDRLIPPDETGPSASQAGVVVFLDRQLAGDYGNGARLNLEGPWPKGEDSQGYQSRFTPAQFYRHAIGAIEAAVARQQSGKSFADLPPDRQDALLKQMESDDLKLDSPIGSKSFFDMFLQNVREGYFSDPIYGGNKDAAAWKMIGFPGAHYDYSPWVTAYNQPVPVEPVGLRGRRDWTRG